MDDLAGEWGLVNEIGLIRGGESISWQEVVAWESVRRKKLTQWASLMVVDCSREFVRWQRKGARKGCQPPIIKKGSEWLRTY